MSFRRRLVVDGHHEAEEIIGRNQRVEPRIGVAEEERPAEHRDHMSMDHHRIGPIHERSHVTETDRTLLDPDRPPGTEVRRHRPAGGHHDDGSRPDRFGQHTRRVDRPILLHSPSTNISSVGTHEAELPGRPQTIHALLTQSDESAPASLPGRANRVGVTPPPRTLFARTRVEIRPYQRITTTLAAAGIAPLVPRRLDPALTRVVARLSLALMPRRQRRVAERMAEHLGPDRDNIAESAAYWLQRVETRWGQARGISVAGWKPNVEINGLHHLVEADAAGRGTILWRISSHTAIPLNQALAAHGFAPVHLSKSNHLMATRDNRLWRFVSPKAGPILRKAEDAPLRARVEYGNGSSPASAMRRLMSALSDNEVVTIVGDLASGRKVHEVTVNHQKLRLANGGARLAVKTGAALIPVSLSRTGPLRYRVDIVEPLIAPDGVGTDAAVESLIEQFADVLGEFIHRQPSQWPKWRGPTS